MERDLPRSRRNGSFGTEAKCPRSAYAADGILSLSAQIYQLGRYRDARAAGNAPNRRDRPLPRVEARTCRRKTGVDLRQCDSGGPRRLAPPQRDIATLIL